MVRARPLRTRMLSIQANLCCQCMIRSVSPNRGSPPDRDTHTRFRDTGAHTHTDTDMRPRTHAHARARARKRRGKQRMSMFMCLTIVYVSIALLQCSAIHCLLYCILLHSTESFHCIPLHSVAIHCIAYVLNVPGLAFHCIAF